MRAWLLLVGLTLAVIGPKAAWAHPHVFIDNRLTFLYAGGELTGFRTDWRFDEIFTADLLAQYDANSDGQFDEAESKQVEEGTLPNLAGFHYFTYAYLDGQDLGELVPDSFKADIVSGAVRFVFTYRLPHTVDPRRQKMAVSIYDREYYVEVLLAEQDPVSREGEGADGCGADVADDPDHAYYGGFVVPQIVGVRCP
ncbi:DUF1007 family protein [Dongia sp.]|uniref:DUF1007 family protein n=1 Tax=Dongia sp. TaxID=1977262 RepID=UPI0035AEFA6F